jgi:hypothetical protein
MLEGEVCGDADDNDCAGDDDRPLTGSMFPLPIRSSFFASRQVPLQQSFSPSCHWKLYLFFAGFANSTSLQRVINAISGATNLILLSPSPLACSRR